MAPPLITLVSYFGCSDGYVGAMKGVLLPRCPGAQLVDISHDILRLILPTAPTFWHQPLSISLKPRFTLPLLILALDSKDCPSFLPQKMELFWLPTTDYSPTY